MGIRLDCHTLSDKEAAMYRRPVYVSLAGWFLTFSSALALLFSIRMLFMSDGSSIGKPIDGRVITNNDLAIFALVVSVLTFICGVNILDGANWARWFYTVMAVFLFVADGLIFLYLPHNFLYLIPSEIERVTMIICFFLPGANRFFSPDNYRP